MLPDSIDNWIDGNEAAKLLRCSSAQLRDKAQSCGQTGCVGPCCVFKAFPQIRRTYHLKRYWLWGPDVEAVWRAVLAPPPPLKSIETIKLETKAAKKRASKKAGNNEQRTRRHQRPNRKAL